MMHKIVKRGYRFLLCFLGLILYLGIDIRPSTAQASGAYDVVAAVNDFRAANGLPPLQVDSTLMSIAQAHSDYQASIGTVTHTGPDGSSPKDRAYAAGFGGGATIFLSENIAGGRNMSIQTAIFQYWQDQTHLYTMLNPAAVYIGAGVGIAGDTIYYTVDAGYYAGAPSSGSTLPPADPNTTPAATTIAYDPFIISTPREDGAVIHTVGYGQSLIGIANTYGVELNTVLALNNLTMNSIIYTGDQLVIQTAEPPTPTVPATETKPVGTATASKTTVPTGTETQFPTKTPDVAVPSDFPTNTDSQETEPPTRERLMSGVVIMALVVLLAVIVSGITAGKERS